MMERMESGSEGNMEADKQPLKVLIASRSFDFRGGVANYVHALVENVDQTRVAFTHVAVSKAGVSSSGWRRPLEYLDSILRFGKATLNVRPDVVHLNPSLNNRSLPLHLILLLLSKLLGQSVYLFFHGWDDRVALAMMNGTWKGRFLRGILRRADYCSVLSERFQNQLIQAGWSPSRVQVLPLMIEVAAYQTPQGCEASASNDDGDFQVLFLSRLAPDKGVWELMEAVEWLREAHPDAPLKVTCAGDGTEYEPLRRHVQANELSDMVQLPGYLRGEDKFAAYRGSDLFVFPSHHAEGFPIAVIESLAAGLPVIYTPVGALAEILGPENGTCIEVAEVSGETVGDEIWKLYQDPGLRKSMGELNQKLAQRYDVKIVCADTVDVYRRVATGI
jgi:glycosyltransferase involved in cell wall biosynthesis